MRKFSNNLDYKVNVDQDLLRSLISEAANDGIQKILAGAQIYKDGKLLLLVRADDEFMPGLVELPSGTIDPGETLIEGLVREIKEETNLDVSYVSQFVDYFDYSSSSGKKARQFNFVVTVSNEDIILNSAEHKNYIYVEPLNENLESLGVSQSVRDSIGST